MMLTSLALSLLLGLAAGWRQGDCPCDKFVFTGDVLQSHMVVNIFEATPYREIRGSVTDINGEPIEAKAFIFVSRMPGNISREDYTTGRYKRGRHIIACETLSDGKFCFRNIRPGKYEVCATSLGFNNTCMLITTSRKGRRAGLDIRMEAGT